MKNQINISTDTLPNFSAVENTSICLKCYAEVSEELLYCEKCSLK